MTKKIIFITLTCLCCIYTAQSQKFKGGLQLGMLATQVDGDNRGSYNKVGLFIGAFTAFPLHDENMQLQLEIDYAQKGSKSTGKNSDGTLNKSKLALHQMEVPVLYTWKFLRKISATGGLSLNMIVDTKVYDSYGDVYIDGADDYEMNFFELGLLLGLNYHVDEHYGLSFRYAYSLTPIGKSFYRIIGLRNNALQFHLSYRF